MKRIHPRHSLSWLIAVCSLGLLMAGCASTPNKYMEQLGKVTKIYNNSFESKSETGGATMVKKEMRSDYLIRYAEIRDRISINESQAIDYTYLQDGDPVVLDISDPDKDFNEVLITMRYQYILSPSNQLKTIISKQQWRHNGIIWQLEPDLDAFLK